MGGVLFSPAADAGVEGAVVNFGVKLESSRTALSVEGSTPALGAGSRGSTPLGSTWWSGGGGFRLGEHGVVVAPGPSKSLAGVQFLLLSRQLPEGSVGRLVGVFGRVGVG